MRLRSGALPIFLVTVSPRPGGSVSAAIPCSENAVRPARLPRAALRNCARLVRRLSVWGRSGPAVMRPRPSGGDALAAEHAAAVEDLAAVLGSHAGTKTVAA